MIGFSPVQLIKPLVLLSTLKTTLKLHIFIPSIINSKSLINHCMNDIFTRGRSIITLSQNDQYLDTPSPIFRLVQF